MAKAAGQNNSTAKRGKPDQRVGTVISDKGNQTITVRYEFTVKHPKYGKYYRRSGKLHTHDEKNEARIGDLVEVVSCRPYSKTKNWRLNRIVKSAEATH